MKKFFWMIMFLLISMSAFANSIKVAPDNGTSIELSGTVIGPVQWGSESEGNFFKAYHLKLDKPETFNDDDSCGEQAPDSLPINEAGMDKFKGKRVTIKATVVCQTERTGKYHLIDVKVSNQK